MNNLAGIIAMVKGLLPLGGRYAHEAVERVSTPPKKVREQLYRGMTADQKAEAERLVKVAADANSDAIVYIASNGAIEADEEGEN